MEKSLVLNKDQLQQKIDRLAWQIYEQNYKENEIIIAGIAKRGVLVAQKLADKLTNISSIKVKLVTIKLDKDNPYEKEIEVDITESEFKDKVLILVDDVLNSGKTLIYGTKHFLSAPIKRLSTVVLVDRNHNRFPIKADFVGLSLSTTLKEHISVELEKNAGVYLS
ncbi:MAG TPA: phosphoribosyltransferase family protein [Flavobacteriales bacterium]|jgi:pyrimidine operon attenuation protein/uracil phosphoribosyltransferase|nr:phosphoribosyltransferase family protein [Flavobacteriales bacterium]HJN63414.1 phosphoribosyltransferase family protein [Flavobacteriales bacterium]